MIYATAKEWTWSLFSKKHAADSWLLITEEDERRALLICKLIVVALFIAVGFAIRLDIERWHQRQWIQAHPIQRIIDIRYLNQQSV